MIYFIKMILLKYLLYIIKLVNKRKIDINCGKNKMRIRDQKLYYKNKVYIF